VSGSAVNKQEVRFDGAKRDYQGLNTFSTSRGEASAESHSFDDYCTDPRPSVKIQAESHSGGQKAAARREPRPPESVSRQNSERFATADAGELCSSANTRAGEGRELRTVFCLRGFRSERGHDSPVVTSQE